MYRINKHIISLCYSDFLINDHCMCVRLSKIKIVNQSDRFTERIFYIVTVPRLKCGVRGKRMWCTGGMCGGGV